VSSTSGVKRRLVAISRPVIFGAEEPILLKQNSTWLLEQSERRFCRELVTVSYFKIKQNQE
jgi:hypothetical protein